MNKQRHFHILLGLVLCAVFTMTAREFRTPYVFEFGYPYEHYPFCRPFDGCWAVDLWAAGLHRTAGRAFLDKNTTKKEDLAAIFFGSENFTLSQTVLPAGVFFSPDAFPLASVLVFSPRLDYRENSAYFGAAVARVFGCDCNWTVGLRANIPYKDIKVELDSCCELVTQVEELFRCQNELACVNGLPAPDGSEQLIINSCAWRLDFLASIPFPAVNSPGPNNRFVTFVNPDTSNHITLGDQDATAVIGDPVGSAAVHVVSRLDGTLPNTPFTRRDENAADTTTPADCTAQAQIVPDMPFLAADGTGLANEARARFNPATNYSPLGASQANQSRLWVVQTSTATSGGDLDIRDEARTIQAEFENALLNISGLSSATNFLAGQGITFANQRRMGVGDLNTELFVRYDWCNFFGEGIIGAFFPTGKRKRDPGLLLQVPTGNNRHFEVKVGGYFGWNACDWFGFTVDAFYSHAIKRRERVAAAFQGGTIKNIGPAVDADVSWGRFVADIDFTFTVPCIDPCLGVEVGYQAYVKLKDKIRFKTTTAVDLFGITRPLDPNVLELRTKQVAHKVTSEIFYEVCDLNIYAGFQHVFAGKNAPNDTDWYIGFYYYFY